LIFVPSKARERNFMKNFVTQDFLLTNDFTRILYHDNTANYSIIDYLNRLLPENMAVNKQFLIWV